MKSSAREAFDHLTVNFEGGFIDHLFPDVKGYLTLGFGLLLDTASEAATLPWRRPDGSLASRDEIIAEWLSLKQYTQAHPESWRRSYKTFADKTRLRLGREGLFEAYKRKVVHFIAVLREGFSGWDTWCADAQLATLSMAWAQGPKFWHPSAGRNYWPKLTAALRSRDWATAVDECFMDEEAKNPGIIPRNKANKTLYKNAGVIENHLDPEILYWPRDLESGTFDRDAPTLPEMAVIDDSDEDVFPIVHPEVPLDRPALDGDDEPPPQAA